MLVKTIALSNFVTLLSLVLGNADARQDELLEPRPLEQWPGEAHAMIRPHIATPSPMAMDFVTRLSFG